MSPRRKRSRDRGRDRASNRRRDQDARTGEKRSKKVASGGEGIQVRQVPGKNIFEMVFPPCVQERAEDLQEVEAMLAAGETEVAVDELRWLLDGCRSLLHAHRLLGEIALAENDLPLARAHFGYAFEMGREAIPADGLPGPLSYSRPTNQPFFEAGKGLALALVQLGELVTARDVVKNLNDLDPLNPLELHRLGD